MRARVTLSRSTPAGHQRKGFHVATSTGKSGGVKGLGLLTIILGIIFVVAGAVTVGAVSTNLAAEKITVADDASAFQGQLVDTPWEAWVQADIINHHALDASGGKTYSELDREDPVRETMMNASFLRASLFTSIVAFGVGLLVVGLGVSLLIIGLALRRVGSRLAADDVAVAGPARVAPAAAAAPVVAAPASTAPAAPAAAPATAPPAAAPVVSPEPVRREDPPA